MLSEESSRMSKKTHSQDSNSDYIEAKKCDDFIFENRNFEDDRPELNCLNRGSISSPMPKNQLKKDELKNRVLKLKNEVYEEPETIWRGDRDIAHKYLDKVLNIIDEYRY